MVCGARSVVDGVWFVVCGVLWGQKSSEMTCLDVSLFGFSNADVRYFYGFLHLCVHCVWAKRLPVNRLAFFHEWKVGSRAVIFMFNDCSCVCVCLRLYVCVRVCLWCCVCSLGLTPWDRLTTLCCERR